MAPKTKELKNLKHLVQVVAQGTGMHVRPVRDWPDFMVKYYDILEDEASRLTLSDTITFCSGDAEDAHSIAQSYNCYMLDLFLNSVFDGTLRDFFLVDPPLCCLWPGLTTAGSSAATSACSFGCFAFVSFTAATVCFCFHGCSFCCP